MLRDEQIERYARHILLREVGGVGQERLLEAAIRLQGLGQVGSWTCLYLALAGVGSIELRDPRPVPEDGLLPLLGASERGAPRDEAIARVLERHNPDVRWTVGAGRAAKGKADECLLEVAEGKPLLWARASGDAAWIGWVGAAPCSRCVPAKPPGPEAAALAGSLAASRVLAHLLFGETEPGLLRIEGGGEEVVPPCPHR